MSCIQVESTDGESFVIDQACSIAHESKFMRMMLESNSSGKCRVCITASIMKKLISYSANQLEASLDLKMCSADTLVDLLKAAHFLDMSTVEDVIAESIADRMKGQNRETIRQIFGIQNDFTEEEEKQRLRESGWAFK
ncbi:SKP1-like protein 1A [Ziziphus jujuba]|uniref:SKP1-like protein 1A n=2 Tax=Ziziphus jujuba TaxID=326968 RepID=A0A6P4AWL0_ZIZJJ|nr:SKP1-like protein 1A [Ziziphus jujuba]KAH7518785.1 hypothetical protein FEM48_Zijuj09G0207800 [Ziziphus jujuba var. spinosa]